MELKFKLKPGPLNNILYCILLRQGRKGSREVC